jgi:outer membrane receptor for ferrienterochelin and colicin
VPLGESVESNATLLAENVTANVEVTATAPPLVSPSVGLNIRNEEVQALATSRTLQGITTLSPAVNDNTPNTTQVSINGAFAYDNLFMINGVDVNDNLFGSPQNLFIEDAIEETQVITSGVSAEYGRFSGGVVNAITKSGGNTFSGSLRLNLTNPAWVHETPFERDNGIDRESNLNRTYEMTFGGPILRDRLWFFGAGRIANLTTSQTFDVTGLPYSEDDENRRGEIKLTGTVGAAHTLQFGYLNNSRKISNTPSFDFPIEPATFTNQNLPNWYTFGN